MEQTSPASRRRAELLASLSPEGRATYEVLRAHLARDLDRRFAESEEAVETAFGDLHTKLDGTIADLRWNRRVNGEPAKEIVAATAPTTPAPVKPPPTRALDINTSALAATAPTTCSTDGRGLDTDGDGSVDVVPELAAPVVCGAGHGVVAVDTTGLAAPTPVTCLTECPSRNSTTPASTITPAATPASSTATVNIVPELTACAAGIEAFDIDTNGVAVLTPTRCSTGCPDDNPNEDDEALTKSCLVFACSQGGGRRKHPWPPPQIDGAGCMTWDPGEPLNHTLLSHKADTQLFGFKNASVPRLLHQLLVDSTGIGIDMTSPKIYGAASESTDTVAADVSDDCEHEHVSRDMTVVTAQGSPNLIQDEGLAKRAHNQDIFTLVDNNTVGLDKSARHSFNKGDPGSNSQLCVVSTPRCMPPLLEEITCELYDTLLHIETISHVIIINGTSWLWYNVCAVMGINPRTGAAKWRKCSCRHLILPEPHYLLLDCLEVCSAPTYLQLDVVCASVVYMFQQRTSQNWELSRFSPQVFEPDGPSIVTYCYGLSNSSGSMTSELPNDCCASGTNFCFPATTSVHDLGSLEFIEYQFIIVHEHTSELASPFGLEKMWSTRDCLHHVLEYTTDGCNSINDKLQGTIQIMSMSVLWQFLNQEEFKGSDRVNRGCIDFTWGRAAVNRFHIDNSACSSEQVGDLLVHQPHVMVKHSWSLQLGNDSAEVPYWFEGFITRSPQISHAMYYQLEVELKPSWFMPLTAPLEMCLIQYAIIYVGMKMVKNACRTVKSVELCSTGGHIDAARGLLLLPNQDGILGACDGRCLFWPIQRARRVNRLPGYLMGFVLLCHSRTTLLAAQCADDETTSKQREELVQRKEVPWDPGDFTWRRLFSSGYNQNLFKEGGVSQFWLPSSSKSPLATTTTSTSTKSAPTNDCYLDDASFDLAQVYFDDGYHRDSSSTKEHRVSWDPGGKGTASAWGQAEFQGGRIVSNPPGLPCSKAGLGHVLPPLGPWPA